jgi:hypothetical protein
LPAQQSGFSGRKNASFQDAMMPLYYGQSDLPYAISTLDAHRGQLIGLRDRTVIVTVWIKNPGLGLGITSLRHRAEIDSDSI